MSVKRAAVSLILLLLFFLPGFSLFAQSNTIRSLNGDNLTLKIAVIGPGDELYFWWGHIGLIIEDNTSGQSWFFDWGVFSFDNENFFVNFAFGRLIYSCAVTRAEINYNVYTRKNRDITLYTLNLPAEKKEEVFRFAENNMQMENRDYFYHHFDDNCATRIRDIIDMAVDGQFSAGYGSETGRFTLRQHVRRHTWFNPFFDWLLNFLMGQGIDEPITVWDEMFLPSEIARRISEFSFVAADGTEYPLVSSVEILNSSKGRPAVLDVPRLQWPRELAASLFFSLLLVGFFVLKKSGRSFVVSMGLVQSLLGLFFGIVGSMLFFMAFFTDHDYTYNNINIFYVNPLFLALVPLGIIFAFSKDFKKRFAAGRFIRMLWIYVLIGGILTMVMKLFPAFYQQNQVDHALILPLALAMIVIMGKLNKLLFKD